MMIKYFSSSSLGYYRVNYDTQNWAALATALNQSHEVIHLLNRAQIIDDAFNLARNGRLVRLFFLMRELLTWKHTEIAGHTEKQMEDNGTGFWPAVGHKGQIKKGNYSLR